MLSGVCISTDNSLIVVTATSGTIFLYDTTSPKPVQCHYDAHQMGVNGCDLTTREERNLLCTVGKFSVELTSLRWKTVAAGNLTNIVEDTKIT